MNDSEYTPRLVTDEEAPPFVFIFPSGLFPGIYISPERLRRLQEAEARAEEKSNNDNETPKPPRRPNARIGGIALGNV